MKTVLTAIYFFLGITVLQASPTTEIDDLEVGSVLMIGSPSANLYEHIEVPRMNFIIKKGGIADYKTLFESKVIISKMKEMPDGSKIVHLKRQNGKRFFNSHSYIKAKLKEAIASEELVRL
ncbi:MAG: hypothetical protein R2814_09930 [Flavobacteriaceae bacterium]